MRNNILVCLIISLGLVSFGFGQPLKPKTKPTPKNQDAQIKTLKKKIEMFAEAANGHFKKDTVEAYKSAIVGFTKIVDLVKSAKEKLGKDGKQAQAISLFFLGIANSKIGNEKTSNRQLEQSLVVFQELKDLDYIAGISNMLAINYQNNYQHQTAIPHFERAIETYSQIGITQTDKKDQLQNIEIVANISADSSHSYLATGAKIEALAASRQAAELYSIAQKTLKQADAKSMEGRILVELGKTQESLESYQESLKLSQDAEARKESLEKAKRSEAIALMGLGFGYGQIGEKTKSLEFNQKAIEICDEINFESLKARILNNLGTFWMGQGEVGKANEVFEKSARLSEKLNELPLLAQTLNNLGVNYSNLGNYTKAGEYWGKATEVYAKVNDADGMALVLANFGGALFYLGEVEEGKSKLELALKYFTLTKNQPREASTLFLLGQIYQQNKDFPKAIEAFQKVNELSKQTDFKQYEGFSFYYLGTIFQAQKDFQKASQNYFKGLEISRQINQIGLESGILLSLSSLAKEQKNYPLAILYGKNGINNIQKLRSNATTFDKETQSIFVEKISEYYQFVADLLISQGRIAEAEQVLGLLKEAEFYEYVRRDDKVANELKAKLSLTDDETKAFKRYNEFAENIAAIGKEYSELETEKKKLEPNQVFSKQAKFDELSKKLKDATEVFLKFLDELKVEFGEENSRVAQVDSGLQALLKEMNAADTVIISTIASPDRLNLILTTTTFQKAYTVNISSAELNKLVAEFRKAVQNSAVDPRPNGQKLYNILLKPLAKDLADAKIKTLVWSLDGTLRYVPISALWDGQKYLAESYANSVITLASRDKLKDIPKDKSAWKTVGFGVSKSATIEETETGAPFKRQFEALSSVPDELCKVVSDETDSNCKGIINGRKFLDERFTLQEFKNQLGNYPLVHIASHFSLKAGNDKNSYLLLGGGDERRLTIAELNRSNTMFVGVELLTLSACNTAMTGEKKANGVEIEGFGAIAQKQGAKSVLATLWAVADPSTRDLMNEFYTFLSVQKLSKAESLRQSQIKLIYGKYNAQEITKLRSDLAGEIPADANQIPFQKDEKRLFAHPFYWSPFVLIGNWQ